MTRSVAKRTTSSKSCVTSTIGMSTHEIKTARQHVLSIYAVDAGVVVDKIVLDVGGLKPSYLALGVAGE